MSVELSQAAIIQQLTAYFGISADGAARHIQFTDDGKTLTISNNEQGSQAPDSVSVARAKELHSALKSQGFDILPFIQMPVLACVIGNMDEVVNGGPRAEAFQKGVEQATKAVIEKENQMVMDYISRSLQAEGFSDGIKIAYWPEKSEMQNNIKVVKRREVTTIEVHSLQEADALAFTCHEVGGQDFGIRSYSKEGKHYVDIYETTPYAIASLGFELFSKIGEKLKGEHSIETHTLQGTPPHPAPGMGDAQRIATSWTEQTRLNMATQELGVPANDRGNSGIRR